MFTLISNSVYGIMRFVWQCDNCGSQRVEEGTDFLACRDCDEYGQI